jgi:hypothetical protein
MTREDLPEPLTPVTQVKAPIGIRTVMSRRLWPRALIYKNRGAVDGAAALGDGDLMARPLR